ncbi:unnamed protein product, partial [Notodromas monacha]
MLIMDKRMKENTASKECGSGDQRRASAKRLRTNDETEEMTVMIHLMSDLSFLTYKDDVSTYWPNYYFTGYVVGLIANEVNCERLISRPKNNYDRDNFHPALFHIYIGTLWIVQVLRVQEFMGTVHHASQNRLAPHLKDLEMMKIPGPLVDLFRGLSCGHADQAGSGLIGPRLAHGSIVAEGVNDHPVDLLFNCIPPVAILRQNMRRMFEMANDREDREGRCANKICFTSIDVAQFAADKAYPSPFAHESQTDWTAHGRLAPGLSFPLTFSLYSESYFGSYGVSGRYGSSLYNMQFPTYPRDEEGKKKQDWISYLGLDNLQWFKQVAGTVGWICDVFEGSCALKDIPVYGRAPGQAVVNLTTNYVNDHSLRDADGDSLEFSFKIWSPQDKMNHTTAELCGLSQDKMNHTTAELCGLSQVTATFPDNVGKNTGLHKVDRLNNGLDGPFWTRIADKVISTEIIGEIVTKSAVRMSGVSASSGKQRTSQRKSTSEDENELEQMTAMIRLIPNLYFLKCKPIISTYWPNYQFTGYLVGIIAGEINESRMIGDRGFHPALFHIYIGTLWIVQVLRVQEYMGTVHHVFNNRLAPLMRKLEAMRIPGPLVDVFRGLSCGHGEHEGVGLIGPSLPRGPIVADGVNDQPVDLLFNIIPPVAVLRQNMRRLMKIINIEDVFRSQNHDVAQFAEDDSDPEPFAHDSETDWTANGRLAPGLCFPLTFAGCRVFRSYKKYPVDFPVYSRDKNDGKLQDWSSYLGFDCGFKWFSDLAEEVDWINDLFVGSIPLGDIPIHGHAPGQALVNLTTTYADDHDLRDAGGNCLGFSFKLWSPLGKVDPMTAHLSGLSQVTANFPANVGKNPDFHRVGRPNSGLEGPFWARTSDKIISTEVNPVIGIRGTIQSMMK